MIEFQITLKRILFLLITLCALLLNQTAIASNGLFFNIAATGSPTNLNATLCLNGNGVISCQNYAISAANLSIKTTLPNHVYTAAGIKMTGQSLTGCTPISNGYCLFSVSDITSANITINGNVTNPVITASSGLNGTITPNGSVTVNKGGSQLFTATPTANYGVNQWLLDGVPVQSGGSTYTLSNITSNHTIKVTFAQATLTSNIDPLALSVNCPTATAGCVHTNIALTGKARQITLTNNGSIAATNMSIVPSGFPPGTTISSSTCTNMLLPNASCVITISPGTLATSNCTTGTAPDGFITVKADDAIENQVKVWVLSYGCIYQDGYVYSVDDTTLETQSIGGKVAALVNQATENAPGIIWSADNSGSYDGGVSIWGIDDASTAPNSPSPNAGSFSPATHYLGQLNCNGATDGSCNTNNIYIYYSTLLTPPLSSYATGLCKNMPGNWYLPSICEMGPDSAGICSVPPLTQLEQNMAENLSILIDGCSGPQCLADEHWSSTEGEGNPSEIAWSECFAPNGTSSQCLENKDELLGVRCSKALTY